MHPVNISRFLYCSLAVVVWLGCRNLFALPFLSRGMKIFAIVKPPQKRNGGVGQQPFLNGIDVVVQAQNGTAATKFRITASKNDATNLDARQGSCAHDTWFACDLEYW